MSFEVLSLTICLQIRNKETNPSEHYTFIARQPEYNTVGGQEAEAFLCAHDFKRGHDLESRPDETPTDKTF